jgi:redox-sensitive bicupin YhaK (pirin superfamily)
MAPPPAPVTPLPALALMNLPARDKMCAPWCRDIPAGEIPEAHAPGVTVRVIAGQPLGEPIAQYGPFVMNTNEELYQAVEDYCAGRLA